MSDPVALLRNILNLESRRLTPGEVALSRTMFGAAINCAPVRLIRARFWPLHPRDITMAPDGNLWFHPDAAHYCEDFSCGPLSAQAHFIHEMTHVWQAQQKGRWWLVLHRHPFCRYRYRFIPGKQFTRYGIEQQAEIMRHLFLARHGHPEPGAPPLEALEEVVPFDPPRNSRSG